MVVRRLGLHKTPAVLLSRVLAWEGIQEQCSTPWSNQKSSPSEACSVGLPTPWQFPAQCSHKHSTGCHSSLPCFISLASTCGSWDSQALLSRRQQTGRSLKYQHAVSVSPPPPRRIIEGNTYADWHLWKKTYNQNSLHSLSVKHF